MVMFARIQMFSRWLSVTPSSAARSVLPLSRRGQTQLEGWLMACSTFMRRDHSHLFTFKQQTHAILESLHQFEGMFFFLAVLYADDTVLLSLCLSC